MRPGTPFCAIIVHIVACRWLRSGGPDLGSLRQNLLETDDLRVMVRSILDVPGLSEDSTTVASSFDISGVIDVDSAVGFFSIEILANLLRSKMGRELVPNCILAGMLEHILHIYVDLSGDCLLEGRFLFS